MKIGVVDATTRKPINSLRPGRLNRLPIPKPIRGPEEQYEQKLRPLTETGHHAESSISTLAARSPRPLESC